MDVFNWKLWTFFLLVVFSTNALSSERLYSLTAASRNAPQEGSDGVSVQLALSSAEQLSTLKEVTFPLPDGQLVSGTVVRVLAGGGPTEVEKNADSVTVITLKNNGGSLRLAAQDGNITGIFLVDAKTRKNYQASVNNSGSGMLQEVDRNKYQCVDFPGHNHSPLPVEMLAVAELTPDLSTLQNLESRPGASNTLYVNYWGGTLSGTAWNDDFNSRNDITYTPYSSDSDVNSFSATERYRMWLGWLEAAEDFASFDINVTTKESVYLATPTANRIQMIITTTDDFYSGAGGVAFVGVFDTSDDYYRTAFTWNSGSGSLGMTISHEAGHQIGLYHDGNLSTEYYSGHGVWGPIMGAPFNQAYVQWSKGEYTNANNQENDLNIIQGVLGSLADDAGSSNASAAALTLPVTDREGQITPNGVFPDVDVYSFYASGTSHVEVKPLPGDEGENRAANLAINVNLKNAAGTVIASIASNDNSSLAPSTNTFVYDGNLPAGTYYLTIDAVSPNTNWATGFGEYGNGGMYRISATTTPTPTAWTVTPSTVGGGSISPSTPQSVVNGLTTSFTVTPDTGYKVTMGGTCGGTLNGTTYTTEAITANCTVTASFTLKNNSVSITPAGTGSGTTVGDGNYDFGDTVTLTATPGRGSTFDGWSGDAICAASFRMPELAVNCIANFVLNDDDDDGVADFEDNCPSKPNPDQADGDKDGTGDVCEELMFGNGFEGIP